MGDWEYNEYGELFGFFNNINLKERDFWQRRNVLRGIIIVREEKFVPSSSDRNKSGEIVEFVWQDNQGIKVFLIEHTYRKINKDLYPERK